MVRFYLTSIAGFGILRLISLLSHYFGFSPYGGKLETRPWQYFPAAFLLSMGVLFLMAFLFSWWESRTASDRKKGLVRTGYLGFSLAHVIIGQIDLEVFRWTFRHLDGGFFRTYLLKSKAVSNTGNIDFALRMFSYDKFQTLLAVLIIASFLVFAGVLWTKRKAWVEVRPALLITLAVTSLFLFTGSRLVGLDEGVKERIALPEVNMVYDTIYSLAGEELPRFPEQAFSDLMSFVQNGVLASENAAYVPQYPLAVVSSSGEKLPVGKKTPNVVMIILESYRGWEMGLVDDPSFPSNTPELDAFLKANSSYFPWASSNGFPSAVGTLSIMLGSYPHFRAFVATDYQHNATRAIPQVFRENGYRTEIVVGADPSISNFTPWFNSWFDTVNFDLAVQHDGPLLETVLDRYDAMTAEGEPFFLSAYTYTLHLPYNVPETEDVEIADTTEGRYAQAIHYSSRKVTELLMALKDRPEWKDTVVVIVGDHAYPEKYQLENPDQVGSLCPGMTWIPLAFTGGWTGLPEPGEYGNMASQVDVAPTLLSIMGISPQSATHFMGRDLFNSPDRPTLAVRENWLVLQDQTGRALYNMRKNEAVYFAYDKNLKYEYGLMEGTRVKPVTINPDDLDLPRYADMFRAYGVLLNEDRLIPHQATSAFSFVTATDSKNPPPQEPVRGNDL